MQPCRITTRVIPRAARASNPARTMFTSPFLPHIGGDLFRVFDSAMADLVTLSPRQPIRRSFTPKFDVREIGSTYELQGELPGMEQKDLDIEFVDERTLVVRGKSARETTSSNVDINETVQKAAEDKEIDDNASEKSANYQKATVEEEYVDAGAEASQGSKTPLSDNAATVEAVEANKVKVEPASKYWVRERSVGEFERRFSFPGRVDQQAVKASLKNGILSIVVPKTVEKQARRIEIL